MHSQRRLRHKIKTRIASVAGGVFVLAAVASIPSVAAGQVNAGQTRGEAHHAILFQLKESAGRWVAVQGVTRPTRPAVPAACKLADLTKTDSLPQGEFASQGLSFPAKYTSDGNGANIAAARADAVKLLTTVTVPTGATTLPAEPAGDHGYLNPEAFDTAAVARNEWWTTSVAATTVLHDFEVNPPDGSVLTSVGAEWTGLKNKVTTCAAMLTFQLPAVVNVLGQRSISFTATKLNSGQTGILVSSSSTWVSLRSTSERVPADVSMIRVTSVAPGKRHGLSRTFTGAARIGAVTALINAMPTVQPDQAWIGCPAMQPVRTITVGFFGAKHQRLALMSYTQLENFSGGIGGCNSVGLEIGSRWRTPLLGGKFVYTLQRLVGMKLL